jgi:outer membrane protein TolC
MLAAAAAFAAPSRGGDAPPVVRPEAVVNAALQYSPAVRLAAGQVGVAEARRRQARGAMLPQVDARLQAATYRGIEPFVMNGVTVVDAIEDRAGWSAGVTVPVFTGGRLDAMRRSAEFARAAAGESRAGVESDVALQGLTAFWTWSKAYHGQAAVESAVVRMETHAVDIRNRRTAGLATEHEALATEVALDQMRLRMGTARRNVNQARAWIAYLTGAEPATNAVPLRAGSEGGAGVPSEADALAAAAVRPELAARRADLSACEAMAAANRAERLPQVLVTARYEQGRPNMMNIPPKDEWQDDRFIAASVSWTLFDWGVLRAKEAEAHARCLQARARLAQAEAAVAYEVRDARIRLQEALERAGVAERAEESARKSLKAVTDLWQGGLARHAEVLDAHTQLAESENQVLAARADAALAKAALEHATGATGVAGRQRQ